MIDVKYVLIITGIVAVLMLLILIRAGLMFAGPFKGLAVNRLQRKYPTSRKGEILFYGASNFALWADMEADLAPFAVQNVSIKQKNRANSTRVVLP